MTVPEEGRPKTGTTDQVIKETEDSEDQPGPRTGATLREAFEEADVHPEDFEEGSSEE
ncbi:hypothetical protein ACF1DY_09915 [Streptomyces albus]|uniref:hypothetical protein n=1 Tax=Streptomyces albus TaxID=1888 RepID=UPI0036FF642B